LKAARTGDAAAAASALAELISVNDGADEPNKIIEMQLSALVKFAQGKRDEALAIMRNATQREDAMPVEFGPPAVLKPTHELYGELLLEAGKPGEAYQQFTAALKLAPRRARSLVGLARSAKTMGDTVAANKASAELKEDWHRADKGVGLDT
jgi:predicted Zn-dependent protease